MMRRSNDSFERDQTVLASGEKREPDYAAIRRHQRYQSELRKSSSVVRFFRGRVAFLLGSIAIIALGSNILDMSNGGLGSYVGVALLVLGCFLAITAVFGKHVWFLYFLSSFLK